MLKTLRLHILIIVLITAISLSGVAQSYQCMDLFSLTLVENSQERPLTFKKVEVLRRNNHVGLQQVGDIQFEKWIEVGPFAEGVYNQIGLTKEGKLYHLVNWKSRKIARLLSGDQFFKSLFLFKNKFIIAVDFSGEVFVFSPSKWLLSPLKDSLRRGIAIWTGTSLAVTALVGLVFPDMVGAGSQSFSNLSMTAGFVATITAMNTFFIMVQRYDRLNTFPNGFIPLGFKFTQGVESLQKQLLEISEQKIEQLSVETYLKTPDLDSLDPQMPEAATEDIR